jgi:hypothetical protein
MRDRPGPYTAVGSAARRVASLIREIALIDVREGSEDDFAARCGEAQKI